MCWATPNFPELSHLGQLMSGQFGTALPGLIGSGVDFVASGALWAATVAAEQHCYRNRAAQML